MMTTPGIAWSTGGKDLVVVNIMLLSIVYSSGLQSHN